MQGVQPLDWVPGLRPGSPHYDEQGCIGCNPLTGFQGCALVLPSSSAAEGGQLRNERRKDHKN